jgi:hypothetical protein
MLANALDPRPGKSTAVPPVPPMRRRRGGGRGLPKAVNLAGEASLYAYVRADPVNQVDPSGMNANCVTVPGSRAPHCGPPAAVVAAQKAAAGGSEGTAGAGGARGGASGPLVGPAIGASEAEAGANTITITGTKFAENQINPFRDLGNLIEQKWNEMHNRATRPTRPDRCGSEATPGVPDEVGGVDISAACAVHDQCYATAGAEKRDCDLGLGLGVDAICYVHTQNAICGVVGGAYFWGVTIGGNKPSQTLSAPHESLSGERLVHMEGWYKGVLLTWLGFGIPVILLAIGFAGGNPLRDLDFSFYTFTDIVLWGAGCLMIFAPVWLAPFGLRLDHRDSCEGRNPPPK